MTSSTSRSQRRSLRRFLFIGLLLSIFSALGVVGAQEQALPDQFSGALAFEHVADHVNSGYRQVATLGSYRAGNLILNKLEELGWTTSEDWHIVNLGDVSTFSDEALQALEDWNPLTLGELLNSQVNTLGAGTENWRDARVGELLVPVRNLVATYGSPENGIIILGAHYDSRIYSDKDPVESNRRLPMPGANDGGSGVGVLLELARVLSTHYLPNYQIRLVFFDAEDNGRIPPWTNAQPSQSAGYIVGSSLYAQNLNLSRERVMQMILVDLVGEFDQRFPQEGYSVNYAPDLTNAIWAAAADLGYSEYFPMEQRGAITDDHVPFIQRGIPSVDIIDLEYEYWDTSLDTLDKISPDSLERVGRVLQAYLERVGIITPR